MSRRIIIREDAFDDLDRSSATISEDSARASVRFLEEAQQAFGLLADMPGIGTPRDYDNPDLLGMRMCPGPNISQVPDLLFYDRRQD